ncbi:MAG: hypothetical protein R3B12_01335 [Candidatus Saccharimonadales bacterium]
MQVALPLLVYWLIVILLGGTTTAGVNITNGAGTMTTGLNIKTQAQ